MQDLLRLKLTARLENLRSFMEPISACAAMEGLGPKRIAGMELALEEALVNIMNYAYPGAPGEIEVSCRMEGGRFIIELADRGKPFDMTSPTDPDLSSEIEDRKVGGLGLFLMKKMVDGARYRREGDRNLLELVIERQGERQEEENA